MGIEIGFKSPVKAARALPNTHKGLQAGDMQKSMTISMVGSEIGDRRDNDYFTNNNEDRL
ncbi:hypothetical protein [Olivibacter sitiensis]|uniref:hypothetical protein n=1 Tax=Olivibacter sitiensis TaxID=376470 RepID=UPI00040E69F9|nr:hypothetical protein [Olivibacter sitiensis]